MIHRPSHSAGRNGFTLPEILLALSLLSVGVATILMLFPLGARMQMDALNDTSGRVYAETALAAFRANAGYMGSQNVIINQVSPYTVQIFSNTPSLPVVPSPSGNYQYRACYWQSEYNNVLLPNHFNAAVFAFNSGTGELGLAAGGVTNPNAGGLAILSVGLPFGFPSDQWVLLQDISSPNKDVYIERVVNVVGASLTVTPAMPATTTGHGLRVVYLPQGTAAIATGSIQ